MTWSPRNRQADDDDDDEDDDEGNEKNERPSSSVSVLSDEPRRDSSLLENGASNTIHGQLNGVYEGQSKDSESDSPRKKIWSIADTLNPQRTTTSSSCSSSDDLKVYLIFYLVYNLCFKQRHYNFEL